MATVYLLDSVKVATSTTGTGTVTVGAAETGYLTPAEAGAVDTQVYTWRLDDGNDFEIFIGTYSSTGPTVSRDTVLYSKISGVAGTSKLDLSGSATLSAVPVADYVVTPRQIREKLTANRTYYVRTDGSDSNDGLTNSSGGAFLTIQKAVDTCLTLDLNGNDVTIQVGAGTYTAGVGLNKRFVGGNVALVGDTTTPSNVVISRSSGDCVNADGAGVNIKVRGFKLVTSSGNGLFAANQAVIQFGEIDFGACSDRHIRASSGGVVKNEAVGDYTISGDTGNHMLANVTGMIAISGVTITLSGTRAWSGAGLSAQAGGQISFWDTTISGSATGTRYSATLNGVINTFGGGASYWPGDVAGTTATGGQYV